MNPNSKLQSILLACLSSWSTIGPQVAFAFAASAPGTAVNNSGLSESSSSCPSSSTNSNGIGVIADPQLAKQRIQSGRVYVHSNFFSEDQVRLLRRDMRRLESEGKFIVNGLSDVRKGLKGEPVDSSSSSSSKANQGFDVKYDRSVCPIPWWKDSLSLSMEGGGQEAPDADADDCEKTLLHSIQMRLQRLRRELSQVMERPTMLQNELGHECYYSQSSPGSSLARHMDERHEETKGPRGWLLPSRRSLSWLVYLSETADADAGADADGSDDADDATSKGGGGGAWDAEINGGLLRTFPQKRYRNLNNALNEGSKAKEKEMVECGSHNGNLQVGWLIDDNDANEQEMENSDASSTITHPVFLDSWFDEMNPYTQTPEPHCILYIVHPANDAHGNIEYITVPWSIDAIGGGNVADFIQQSAKLESGDSPPTTTYDDGDENHHFASLFLQRKYARQFQLLEDRDAWSRGEVPAGTIVEDFAPTRATLVVFDSVTLPHEVTAVVMGRRAALAGWFHEETQPLGGNNFQY